MKGNKQRPKRILHDTPHIVNDYNEFNDRFTENALLEYNGGCESYEDPADYIAKKPIRGVIVG